MKIIITFEKVSDADDLHELMKDHTVALCQNGAVKLEECLLFEACETLRPSDIKKELSRYKFGHYHVMVKYIGDYSFKNFI